jgi:peroxiredoxin
MDQQLAPLAAGTPAPDFSLRHTPGSSLSLRRFAGRPVVLVFYPMAFEPVSEEQLTLYQEYLPEFDRLGAQVLGISTEHVWCSQAFARQAGIQFPLLSDVPSGDHASRRYGVYDAQGELCARALFVIDPSGTIQFGEAYPDLVNPGVDAPLTVLEQMRPA